MSGKFDHLFKSTVLGHPSGLFVLFFTEMWERFSFYGMRILLVLFLTAPFVSDNPGWEWPRENAMALFGTYASLLYLTPIIGGYIADKFTGYRLAVVIGALIMTLGHACMAIETPLFVYLGLIFMVVGTGFFKPTMTSMISEMYQDHEDKKDGAYTVFYMGVNAGAFFGIMLCGYLAETYGWSWGFGLAGIFMLLGMLQFWLAADIFDGIGDKPNTQATKEIIVPEGDKLNPFTLIDKILMSVSGLLGFTWLINDPLSKIGNINLFNFSIASTDGSTFAIITALVLFIILLVSRILRYTPLVRDKMIAVAIFAFFTVFFWAAFEQAAGSLGIFARDYTNRVLDGSAATIFKICDTILTVTPLIIVTYVLYLLFKQTYKRILLSNIILAIAFILVWIVVGVKLNAYFSSNSTEVAASWFGILNSFFIIALAPLFSKWWESKYNPSAAMKYCFGLVLLGLGFGFLAYGSKAIPQGAESASISMVWLIMAYLFHTLGELCLSPLGLSYISKLVPSRMIALMFGVWYLAIAIGNKLAGKIGGEIDKITEHYDMATFFLIFTIVPIAAGLLIALLNPVLNRLMHGVK